MLKFMHKGTEGEQLTKQANADQAARKAAGGNSIFRFWMPENDEKQITFLDGELSESGLLDVPRYWEHNLKLGDSWKNWFPCTKDEEPCPICDFKQPALVYAFTIIDHSKWAEKKDTAKVHEHERKLYVCKGDTYKRLSKIAVKRGGLAGCTFDVSRIGDKAENVGNDFDFVEQLSFKKLAKKYGMETKGKAENNKVVAPYDYDEVIKYHTAEELREMGLGSGGKPVGSADVKKPAKDKKDKKGKKGKGKKGKKGKDKKDKNFDKEL
jgi:hypothetical protein